MNSTEKSFGVYLKELRETYGYTLVELGEKIGYSDAYLSQIEKDKKKNPPTVHLLKYFADALEEPYSNLLEKAGYDELAAGQRLLEMFGETVYRPVNSSLQIYTGNKSLVKKVGLGKNLISTYLELVDEYKLEQDIADELINYVNEMLVKLREYIQVVLKLSYEWDQMEVSHNDLVDKGLLKEAYLFMGSSEERKRLLELRKLRAILL